MGTLRNSTLAPVAPARLLLVLSLAGMACGGTESTESETTEPTPVESTSGDEASPMAERACYTEARAFAEALVVFADAEVERDQTEAIDWSSDFAAWNDLQSGRYHVEPGTQTEGAMFRFRIWQHGLVVLQPLIENGPWSVEEDEVRMWLAVGPAEPDPFAITITREDGCLRIAES